MSSPSKTEIMVWEQDPGSRGTPDGGVLILRPQPKIGSSPFPTAIEGDAIPFDNYPVATEGFRYWAAADALRRASDLWGSLLPGQQWNPAVGATLPVVLDEGVDLNAYYDRRALNFFHAVVNGRTVYSGESPDIVAHEFGHAVLDAVRPQLWDAASIESGAFHEAFGDVSAMLTALQLVSLRQGVITETGGNLYRSSRLSRLAEQLGWAIRQDYPTAVDPDCLRNAVNRFFYKDPDDLPTSAPASELSSEVHSFSRVFSGAFLEAIAAVFASQKTQTDQDLQRVSMDLGGFLLEAIKKSPVTTSYYSQIAAHLVQAAVASKEEYAPLVQGAMVHHGILSASGATRVATAPRAAAAPPPPLGLKDLDVSAFGLSVKKIKAQTVSQPKTFAVTGAAPTTGDLPARSDEDAALVFVEDLIRRGRLDTKEFGTRNFARVVPRGLHTHELRKEGGEVVLRRLRVDCGFGCGAPMRPRRPR